MSGGRFDARRVTHPSLILISPDDSDAAGCGKLHAEVVDGRDRLHSHDDRTPEDGIVRRPTLDHHEVRHDGRPRRFFTEETTNSMLPSGKIEYPVKPCNGLAAAPRLCGLILIFSRTSKYRMSTELSSSIRNR